MRVADKMRYDQVNNNVGKNRSTMQELQNQAASQKRVTKPSDDPLAASRVLADRIDLQGNKQFTKNLNYAKSFLQYTDQSLGDATEVMSRAKELAINQSNDASGNEESRRAVATEVQQLYSQLVNIGNRKLGERFIFGGFKTQVAPFDFDGKYHGDPGEMNIHIDKEAFLPMNIPGGRVFLGQGVDRGGMVKASAPQPKTIEEWNQRPVFPERDSSGEEVAPEMRSPASVGGMRTSIPSAENAQRVENPSEAAATNAKGVNLFRTLKDLEISLRTNDKGGIQGSLDQLDDAISQTILSRSQVGSRSMALDNYMQAIEKEKVDDQISISQLEDADIFSTVSDINKNESTLQATLQTSGKMIEKSLLDFLR